MHDVFFQQREEFRDRIRARLGVTDAQYDEFNRLLAPLTVQVQLRKGELLQQAGVPARHGYWLYRGVARRALLTHDGDDATMDFAVESDACGSHHDLLAAQEGKPAQEFIMAETAIVAVRIEWEALVRLREAHPGIRDYYLKVSEDSIRRYSHSSLIRSMNSAHCRLDAFRERFPGLETRISQKSMASYLGITPQYMSTLLRQEQERGT